MANLVDVLFNRTPTPNEEEIIDGQIIFDTSGSGKMYLDVGGKRLEMGGAKEIDQVLNKLSTNAIQNRAVAGVMISSLEDIDNVNTEGFLIDVIATKSILTKLKKCLFVDSFDESTGILTTSSYK
mgnify:FL=1|jgi:hypothetical protein